jgi:hypothetical protein
VRFGNFDSRTSPAVTVSAQPLACGYETLIGVLACVLK